MVAERPNVLPLRGINHISRICREVRQSVDFYSLLGFVPIRRPASFDFEGAWLFNYGIGIHLLQGEPSTPRTADINPMDDHLSFQSDSLPAVRERLESASIKYVEAAVEENGIRIQQIFFHDPDSNMIEICNCDCLPIRPLSPGFSTPHNVSAAFANPVSCLQPQRVVLSNTAA